MARLRLQDRIGREMLNKACNKAISEHSATDGHAEDLSQERTTGHLGQQLQRCPSKRPQAAQLQSTDVGVFSKRLPSAAFSSGARTCSKTSATAALLWSEVAAGTDRSVAWQIAAARL